MSCAPAGVARSSAAASISARTGLLDLVDLLGHGGEVEAGTLALDDDVVLDANAPEIEETLGLGEMDRRLVPSAQDGVLEQGFDEIDSRLHGDDEARLELGDKTQRDFRRVLDLASLAARGVVDVEPQHMGQAMRVEDADGAVFDKPVRPSPQEAEGLEALGDDAHGAQVEVGRNDSRAGVLDAGFLGRQHDLVDVSLAASESPVDGEGPGDIGGIALELAAGVDEDEIAVLEERIVAMVMKHGRVRAGGDDGGIGEMLEPGPQAGGVKDGLQLVFAHSGAGGGHDLAVGGCADLAGAPHEGDLFCGLAGAQLVKSVAQRCRRRQLAAADEGLQAVGVEDAVDAEEVARLRGGRDVSQPDAMVVVDAGNEEDVSVGVGVENEVAAGLLDARQVEEIRPLSEGILDVAVARDGNSTGDVDEPGAGQPAGQSGSYCFVVGHRLGLYHAPASFLLQSRSQMRSTSSSVAWRVVLAVLGLVIFVDSARALSEPAVLSGLDVLQREDFAPLRGKKIGLITNQTGRDSRGRSNVDILSEAPGVTLAAVFSPEHGFTGVVEAGLKASSSELALGRRRVPVFSLYRGGADGMRPRTEDLEGLDALVFDIQDIGARFYTYLATMGMAMEAAAARKMEFIVLDRPNPINGLTLEGPLTDDSSLGVSPVAYYEVPVRHGLTAGEMARMHAAAIGYGRLTVVRMRGWKREMWYDQTGLGWIPPSPNMPSLESAALYPGVAIFEASRLSVGRGTPWPFRWIGAPWLDAERLAAAMNGARLAGVSFAPMDATPAKEPFMGQPCRGVLMTVTDRERLRSLSVFRRLYREVQRLHPRESVWREETLRRMAGSDQIGKSLDRPPLRFKKARKPYLLYADSTAGRSSLDVRNLTVEEWAGQVFMIAIDTDIAAAREADIRAGRLGGALLRWDRFSAEEARAFAQRMHAWSLDAPGAVPFWLGVDHEGGATFTQRRLGIAPFPGNMALGAANSVRAARESAQATARVLRSLGIQMNFAPALDVNSNPSNPIIGLRSFGEDPRLVARLGRGAVLGYREAGVLATIKHFPGHGDTSEDSHLGLPVSTKTLARLDESELLPFQTAIAAGAEAVMPAHMVFPALGTAADQPVTLSSAAIDGFLRGRLGFKGLVVSDSLDMGAIVRVHGSSEAAVLALLAGNDLLLLGKGDYPAAFAGVVGAVQSGRLPRARLEQAASRILRAKQRLGLFGRDWLPPPPGEQESLNARELARRSAESAVTLVRNDGVIPLKLAADQTLGLVVVRSPRFGEEAAGLAAALTRRHPRVEFVDIASTSPSTAAVAEALERVRGAAAVIVGTYQFGPSPLESQSRLVDLLASGSAPVVALSLMNPYDLAVSSRAKAAVCAYGMTSSALEAAVRLIFGEIPPRGRLPVSVPGVARRGAGLSRTTP